MRKFIKVKGNDLFDTTPDLLKYDFVLTNNTGLAATLGTMGYRVAVMRKRDEYFPSYRIGIDKNIDEYINRYYLGYITIRADLLAQNIEILSNINVPEYCRLEVPLIKASKPAGKQDDKGVKEAKEEQNVRYYENEEDEYADILSNLDDNDIAEIIGDEDLPFERK